MPSQVRYSFAHYEILSKIGAGGMGEVFLARDTKLDRSVAIKFLPEEMASQSDRLARFVQEAKAASALNHPNIITVYEIGEFEGTNFIAVEYIEGKTLRERMSSARISFDEILSIAIQTAEALSAAHNAGIVHRDVKPENIMIRPDGYVKVLDFGLAKLAEQNGVEGDAEDATRKLVKTHPGVVMGTTSYMSPEQARGKEVDARSDVFSFGVVLYEVLTEFENTTDEAIFGQTLKMALSFSIAQSPFLDIVPDSRVSQTLRLMGRKPDERVTRELGEEICMRQNLKAFIAGTISSFGEIYVLTLEAVNARTGESLGREFEQVNSREEVLNALGRASAGNREKLGERLNSIEKFNVPGESITTSSLEALKIFVLGREQVVNGKQLEAIPFYKKALEIDPKFALAYTELAVVYRNTDQWKSAAEMTAKAYELRDTVSETERLRIIYYYHNFVAGEMDKATETLELWRNTSPNFVVSYVSLSDSYERLGQSEKAIAFAREGLRLDPNYATIYMNLVESLVSLDRYEEAKETCRQAFERKLDGDYFHLFPYMVAFI